MLCPQCRRMVGKDGYCPLGHLARTELQAAPAHATPAAPPPVPPPPPVPAEPDPYTPPGLGPSNPPPQSAWVTPSPTTPSGSPPPPPVPSEESFPGAGGRKRGRVVVWLVSLGLVAIALLGVLLLGGSAGAANLKYVFSKGETHRYQLQMSVKVSGGGNFTGAAAFDGSMDMVIRQTVRDISDAGVATVEYSFEKLRLTRGGRPANVPLPSEVITVKMARDGRVLDVSGTGFGVLDDINPAAGLFGPESFGPILPRHKVDPGDSWSLDGDAPNPFGEPFHIKGSATLLERSADAAVIKSTIKSPIDFRIEFAKLAEEGDQPLPAGFPSDAAMTFHGFLSMDLTQAMATKSGFLKSALGDMSMTGTFGLEKVPKLGELTGVLNMTMNLTMTALS